MSLLRTQIVTGDGAPVGSCVQLVPAAVAQTLRGGRAGRPGPDQVAMRVCCGDRSAVVGVRLLDGHPAYVATAADAELLTGFRPDD